MGRNLNYRIARAFVDFMKGSTHFIVFRTIQVALVQDYGSRNIIHLAGHQKSVEERKLDLRKIQCDYKERPVKIGRDDVRLSGQIRGLADDIVAAGMNCSNGSRVFQSDRLRELHIRLATELFRKVSLKVDHVSYRHRIGRIAALEAYLAPEHCREQFPPRKPGQQIMASRMLYDCGLSFDYHLTLLSCAKIVIFA